MIRIFACIVILVALFAPGAALAVDGVSGSNAGTTFQDYMALVINAIRLEGAEGEIEQTIHYDDELTLHFIKFLNRDFRTSVFGKRSNITLVNFSYTIDEPNYHFALAVITFPDSKDAAQAFQAAKAVRREYFLNKILTYFRIFQVDRDFIIILSETAVSPHTRNILDRLTDDFSKAYGR